MQWCPGTQKISTFAYVVYQEHSQGPDQQKESMNVSMKHYKARAEVIYVTHLRVPHILNRGLHTFYLVSSPLYYSNSLAFNLIHVW